MKKLKYGKTIILLCITALMFSLSNGAIAKESKPKICPGSGERCAKVRILGIGLWWMGKTPGGPAIVIEEEEK